MWWDLSCETWFVSKCRACGFEAGQRYVWAVIGVFYIAKVYVKRGLG